MPPNSSASIVARIAEHEAKHAQNQEAIKANEKAILSLSERVISMFDRLNDKFDEQTASIYKHIDARSTQITQAINAQNQRAEENKTRIWMPLLSVAAGAIIFCLTTGGGFVKMFVDGQTAPILERMRTIESSSATRDEVISQRLEAIVDRQLTYIEHERQTYGDTRVQGALQQLILDGRIIQRGP